MAPSDSRFRVLGGNEFEKRPPAKRTLPHWLRNPIPVPVRLEEGGCPVADVGYLGEGAKKRLAAVGVERLFPVQRLVVPWLLAEHDPSRFFRPRDAFVCAPTGGGKTLAYVLPIIKILSERTERRIAALVVTPVKELATQVGRAFADHCAGTDLRVAVAAGVRDRRREASALLRHAGPGGWRSRVDVLVCTPGRLVEHLDSTEGLDLSGLRFLVVDEADRTMRRAQNDWPRHLARRAGPGPPPQRLFFSATLSRDPERLRDWEPFRPVLFSAADAAADAPRYALPSELTETYAVCRPEERLAAALLLLRERGESRGTLCFANSARGVRRLAEALRRSGETAVRELSGELSGEARESVLEAFRDGRVRTLVCTDALARGIDVSECDRVLSYEPPKDVEGHVHRAGRTGRAGRRGTAITVLAPDQLGAFEKILRAVGRPDAERVALDPAELEAASVTAAEAAASSGRRAETDAERRVERLKRTKRGIAKRKRPARAFEPRSRTRPTRQIDVQ